MLLDYILSVLTSIVVALFDLVLKIGCLLLVSHLVGHLSVLFVCLGLSEAILGPLVGGIGLVNWYLGRVLSLMILGGQLNRHGRVHEVFLHGWILELLAKVVLLLQ